MKVHVRVVRSAKTIRGYVCPWCRWFWTRVDLPSCGGGGYITFIVWRFRKLLWIDVIEQRDLNGISNLCPKSGTGIINAVFSHALGGIDLGAAVAFIGPECKSLSGERGNGSFFVVNYQNRSQCRAYAGDLAGVEKFIRRQRAGGAAGYRRGRQGGRFEMGHQ